MRRLSHILPIVLSACVGITVHVPGGGSKEPTKVRVFAGPVGIVIGIRTHLSRLRDDIPARRAQLHPIPCGTATCYSLDEVRDAIAKIRSDAQAAFPEEALASRLTLDEELVRVEDHLVIARKASSNHLIRNAEDHSAHFARAQDADAAFDRAKAPIDTYLAHRELNPTLYIYSQPDGARIRMLIGTNESTMRDAWTQGKIESVWRGNYTGTVTKKGYRDAAAAVDLFHNSGTTVRCTLVPNTAPENDESVCHLGN